RNTLALAEPLFGIAVPLAPVYWLGANAALLHNIAVWASFVIAGTGGYLLGRDLTASRTAGVVCGVIAAFLPYRLSHLSHIQVLMGGWLWWSAWGMHRYFESPTLGRAAAITAFYLLLGSSSLYWLYIGALPLATIAIVEACRRRGPIRTWVLHAAFAAAACLLIFFPIAGRLRPLTTTSAVTGVANSTWYGADLLAYVTVHRKTMVWGSVLLNGNGETDLFPGLAVLVCAAGAFTRRRSDEASRTAGARWTIVYAALGATAALLSLGSDPTYDGRVVFHNPFLPWLAQHLPGFAQLRAISRFALVTQLSLSVLAAFGVAAWLPRGATTRARRITIAGVVSGIVFVEGLVMPVDVTPFSPYDGAGGRRITHWLAQRPGGAVLELPLDGWGEVGYSNVYQHRTLVHGHRTVAGVSRYEPPLPAMLAHPESPLSDPARITEAIPFLRALGVRYVVVHERWYADRAAGAAIRAALIGAEGVTPVDFVEASVVDLGQTPRSAPTEPQRDVAAATMQVSASSGDSRRMLDGDPKTYWTTDQPQKHGDLVDIALLRTEPIIGVRLQMAGSLNEYPRHLEIQMSDEDDGPFDTVFSGSVLPALGAALRRDPVVTAVEIRWPARFGRRVRLRQTGRSNRWRWVIHELRLLAAPGS
nr:discoidin domain-containing protein [Acidobacteriota bacterium]